MSQILVVGASGTVGTELVKALRSSGQKVLEATSQKSTRPEQVQLNLVSGEGLAHAFNGVDKAFLLSPPGYTNQDQLLGPVIDQAKKVGLKKVVLMTAMGANANPEAPLRKLEIKLEQSGLDYNIIRPNWFMQNFNSYWIQGILAEGKIFLPVGLAKGSFIDARDIASVAASLLTSNDSKFTKKDFDLTGSRAIDHVEAAKILSLATGKTIAYQEIPASVMLENLLAAGLPKDYASFLLIILDFFRKGYAERVTDSVEQITGKKPRTFEDYARDYKYAWVK